MSRYPLSIAIGILAIIFLILVLMFGRG